MQNAYTHTQHTERFEYHRGMQHTCTHNTLVHVDYYRSSNRKYQAAYDARMYLPQVTDKNVNSVNKETFPSFAV